MKTAFRLSLVTNPGVRSLWSTALPITWWRYPHIPPVVTNYIDMLVETGSKSTTRSTVKVTHH